MTPNNSASPLGAITQALDDLESACGASDAVAAWRLFAEALSAAASASGATSPALPGAEPVVFALPYPTREHVTLALLTHDQDQAPHVVINAGYLTYKLTEQPEELADALLTLRQGPTPLSELDCISTTLSEHVTITAQG
ncbi:MAG: hypothetical protein LBE25_09440 [Arthrobacter sp.]|jgi:hypothetical protein|nr:hypothetical protein [Arthrobacter sp.]